MAARRVLVIEDEDAARDALGSLLSEEGYVVRTAASGRAGLDCFQEFRPDTVVCDYTLPDIDGLQVVRQMRAVQEEITFIMVTAGCGGDEAEREARAEVDFFLGKPVNLLEFRDVLQGPGADESHRFHSHIRKDRADARV